MENIIEEYTRLQIKITALSADPRIELWIKYLETGGEASMVTIPEVDANLQILSRVIIEKGGELQLQKCIDFFNKKSHSQLQLCDGVMQYLSGCACCAQPARVIETMEFS